VSAHATPSPPTSSARSRNYSGRGKRANFTRACVDEDAGTGLERRTGCAHVIHQNDNQARNIGATTENECIPDIGMPLGRGKVSLRSGWSHAFQHVRGRDRQVACDVLGLIEPAGTFSRSMERDRHRHVGAIEHGWSMLREQRGKRTT